MGAFARIAMTPSEAFAAIALVAVACDGALDKDEAHALRTQLEARSPFRSATEADMGNLFDGLLTRLRQEGWRALISEAIPTLSAQQQETALAMAAQLVNCDRVVQPLELEFLTSLAEQMTIPAERSAVILDVIAVLNRDSLAG